MRAAPKSAAPPWRSSAACAPRATGGMGITGDVHDIARRVDAMLAHAADIAVGVL